MKDAAQAVTVVVTHSVKPGQEQAFETWLNGICEVASRYPGYRGSVTIPQAGSANERHVAFRFDSLAELDDLWSSSDSRAWREQLEELVTQPSRYRLQIGIEHWFMVSDSGVPPSRHRMMVAVFIAILPLASTVPGRLAPWLVEFVPGWVASVATTAVMVLLMTYALMPLVTRILRPWLQPHSTGLE